LNILHSLKVEDINSAILEVIQKTTYQGKSSFTVRTSLKPSAVALNEFEQGAIRMSIVTLLDVL